MYKISLQLMYMTTILLYRRIQIITKECMEVQNEKMA